MLYLMAVLTGNEINDGWSLTFAQNLPFEGVGLSAHFHAIYSLSLIRND